MASVKDFLTSHYVLGVISSERGFWKKLEKVVRIINLYLLEKYELIKLHYNYHCAYFLLDGVQDSLEYKSFVESNRIILTNLCIAAFKKRQKSYFDINMHLREGMLASYEDFNHVLQSFIDELFCIMNSVISSTNYNL